MQAKRILQRIAKAEDEARILSNQIENLQVAVDFPNDHWSNVVREFKIANGMLRQKRDQLILLLAGAMATVAMSRAIEVVSRGVSSVTMVTLEALDLAGYHHGNGEENYPVQLPWLRGKVFDVSESFRGERLIEWMTSVASLCHQKAYYVCQLLLELGVYVQIGGANSQQEMFQPYNFYQWNIVCDKSVVPESPSIPRRLSNDIWPPPQSTGETTSHNTHLKYTEKEHQLILAQVERLHQIAVDSIQTRQEGIIQSMKHQYEYQINHLEQQLCEMQLRGSQVVATFDVAVQYSVAADDIGVQVDLLPPILVASDKPVLSPVEKPVPSLPHRPPDMCVPTPPPHGELVPPPPPPPPLGELIPPPPPPPPGELIPPPPPPPPGELVPPPPPPPPGELIPPPPPPPPGEVVVVPPPPGVPISLSSSGASVSPPPPPPPPGAVSPSVTQKPKQPLRPLFWKKVGIHPAGIAGHWYGEMYQLYHYQRI